MRLIALSLGLLFALLVPCGAAAQVAVTITDGHVSLVAENASVAQILDEWARVGETEFVNGNQVPGGPLTVKLDHVPEDEALDVVLRSAAGFLAVAKRPPVPQKSRFDRVLILPTTTIAPAQGESQRQAAEQLQLQNAPVPPVFQAPEVRPVLGPNGLPLADDQEERFPETQEVRPEFLPPPSVYSAPVPVAPQAPGQPKRPAQSPEDPAVSVGVPVPGMVVPTTPPNPQPR